MPGGFFFVVPLECGCVRYDERTSPASLDPAGRGSSAQSADAGMGKD